MFRDETVIGSKIQELLSALGDCVVIVSQVLAEEMSEILKLK